MGPESAGADPGPICYGRGGGRLTVTDAHVWLGRLPPEAFLGGESSLDRSAIREPLEALADDLGTSLEEAAEGIVEVADVAMERALRVISVERGYDPGEFALVAFGGAGGLHAAALAERLGVGRAVVPPAPGLLSAFGILTAPVSRERSRTVLHSTDEPGCEEAVREELERLRAEAVREMEEEGYASGSLTVETRVDARYRGQSYELRVEAEEWVRRFHDAHRDRYGYAREDAPVEAVTLRAVARAPGAPVEPPRPGEAREPPDSETSRVHWEGESHEVVRVWREALRAGHVLDGPLLVQEYSSTTWVPPAWRLEVDEWGSLHLLPPPFN